MKKTHLNNIYGDDSRLTYIMLSRKLAPIDMMIAKDKKGRIGVEMQQFLLR